MSDDAPPPAPPLRRGWTTGACATAAVKAAMWQLLTGERSAKITIPLPRGGTATLPIADQGVDRGAAWAVVVKDAGDDPDVTHGCEVRVQVAPLPAIDGVRYRAGEGVGVVTKPGLPLPVGEPAINPVPREMVRAAVGEACEAAGKAIGAEVTISIPGGEALAAKTLNPRLGIVGGLSILGTTGVVIPYSCAAWIHSIHRGIDVARAAGLMHVAAATGSTSERVVKAHYRLGDTALIDMGDFAGATLKYLRRRPVPRLTMAGGFAKLAKFALGARDLHSSRSRLEPVELATLAVAGGMTGAAVDRIAAGETGGQILEALGDDAEQLTSLVAREVRSKATADLEGTSEVDVLIVNRQGAIIARAS